MTESTKCYEIVCKMCLHIFHDNTSSEILYNHYQSHEVSKMVHENFKRQVK